MLARDHYATLGVSRNADGDAIDEAYRHLSRRYHPDINPGDPHAATVFERIADAYTVLSDPERRARYDREGSSAESDGDDAIDLRVQLLPDAEDGGSLAELFRKLRDHHRRSQPVRGEDIHALVTVPLLLAERGRRATVEVRRRRPCGDCGGRGKLRLQRKRPCERCNGVGHETFLKGALSISCPCAECQGEGIVYGTRCDRCNASGLVPRAERALVRVPPGARDGQQVRVSGAGHAGLRGGEPGDLVASVRVEPLEGFTREGPHLRTTVPISVAEAILGAKIPVPSPEGEPASLRLPPATQNGREFRLRGRGLEMSDGRRGDMLVRVDIRIPEMIDEDSKKLIREFAARNPGRPRERQAVTG